ncbi:diguanylate cyclase domain-containing protein [Tianweitania populi]|nr:diguanylate cyclase [Tianweitania populi]
MTRHLRYWLFIATLLLGFCGASALMLTELRRDSWTIANTGARNLLTVLSQDIESNIGSYDRVLLSVVTKLEDPAFLSLEPRLQQSFVFGATLIKPYFTSLLVLDKDGNVIRDAGGVPPRVDNFSDRSYFQAHANDKSVGLFISTPFQRRLTGNDEVLGLSRRINAPDGTFAGVVVGTLRLQYFRDLFEQAELKSHDSINLFSQTGTLLMRSPYLEDQIGRDLSATPNVRRFIASSSGSFSGVAAVDGVTRVYNFVRIGNLPLIVNIALSHDDIFEAWRTQALWIGSVLTLLCAMTMMLAFVVRREFVKRALAEAVTRQSEAQYRLLAENATDLIIRLDGDLVRRYVSPASHAMLGLDPSEMVGHRTRGIIHPDDWPTVEQMVAEARVTGKPAEAIYRLQHKSGAYVWVEGRYSFVADDEGFIVVLRDISTRKSAELKLAAAHAELAKRANTDGLTGLANRRRFDEAFEAEHAKAVDQSKSLSLLLIDVDRFKLFNDTYGHQAGDECLRRVAKAIEACIRPSDLCARYGGEEIVVLLPGSDDAAAYRVGERIRMAVESLDIPHMENASAGKRVTISIGCATQEPGSDEPALALIAQADRRLYEAKRTGRNRVLSAFSMPTASEPPKLENEPVRLEAVETFLSSAQEKGSSSLDLIARSAAELLDAPIGFVSLVGKDELTLIGRHGLGISTVPRDIAYCSHTIAGSEPMVVYDALSDTRFKENPLAQGDEGLRFYAGAPLVDPETGETVGAVCVSDYKPRDNVTASERDILKDLSKLVIDELR